MERFESEDALFKFLKEKLEKFKSEIVEKVVNPDMLEEDLVALLSTLDSQKVGLGFFVAIGRRLYEEEAYELLNVIKTHIEYNFDVDLVTKNGDTIYEIRKGPRH